MRDTPLSIVGNRARNPSGPDQAPGRSPDFPPSSARHIEFIYLQGERWPCEDPNMVGDADAAQALVFLAALQEEIRVLSARLGKVESLIIPPGRRQTNRSLELHREAADLRRDISKAHFLIERLVRKFPATTSEATA